MKKLHCLILSCFILSCLGNNVKAQCTVYDIYSNYKIEKIKGTSVIDGQITDWEDILNDNLAYNRVVDDQEFEYFCDPELTSILVDEPARDQDINLLAFKHDDYNVYFYFHRIDNGNSPNSFYYFCDINADGYMNKGEPVFHATFTDQRISSFTLSRYIPDTANIIRIDSTEEQEREYKTPLYIKGKGNPLGLWGTPTIVQGFPMPGKLKVVFDSENIPFKKRLRKNEVFAAALTEEGHGVELAIPWRYLRFWIPDKKKEKQLEELEKQLEELLSKPWIDSWLKQLMKELKEKIELLSVYKWKRTKPLKPEDIFFYKLSLKRGGGQYRASMIVDNVGNSCGGFGKSGDVSFHTNISLLNSPPMTSAYKLNITYINQTNASVAFDIGYIRLNDVILNITPDNTVTANLTIYLDSNCDGIPDENRVLEGPDAFIVFDPDIYNPDAPTPFSDCYENSTSLISISTLPHGKACFIVEIELPDGLLINSAELEILPYISFIPSDPCEANSICASRTIKQIGRKSTSLSSTTSIANQNKKAKIPENTIAFRARVHPNPNNGTTRVYLPAKEGAATIMLEDYLGRSVQQWNNYSLNSLQIENLKRGFYLLRIQYLKTGKIETHKIIVQ